MTERDALLRAVCENPDDDLPRLVLADWLDEHDEPERAEFIRVQCELDRMTPNYDPRAEILEQRSGYSGARMSRYGGKNYLTSRG